MNNKYNLKLSSSREREKKKVISHLTKTTRRYKNLLSKLINAAYDIQENKRLEDKHLALFEEGIRQPWEGVFYSYSGRFISILSHNFKEAEALLIRLANDKDASVRFNVVAILLSEPSKKVVKYTIKKCMKDRSKKVRDKVADVCLRLGYKEALPLLEQQVSMETDPEIKRNLMFSIDILKRGYSVREEGNNVSLWLNMKRGEILGKHFPKEKLKNYSINKIVNSIREKGQLPWGE